jgi:hypothetical protein
VNITETDFLSIMCRTIEVILMFVIPQIDQLNRANIGAEEEKDSADVRFWRNCERNAG